MSPLPILRKDVKHNEFDELFVIIVPGEPMLSSFVMYSRKQAERILKSAQDEYARSPQPEFADFSKAFIQRYVKG